MTAIPDPSLFAREAQPRSNHVVVVPRVTERFWGYEVVMAQSELVSATVMRAVSTFLSVVFLTSALALMLIPRGGMALDALAFKAPVVLALMALSALSWFVASRCRRVRVQIDTRQGEIRQVMGGRFGPETVLSCHSLDSVTSVNVVASAFDRAFGQVQVRLKGYGTIAVADGCVTALSGFSARLRADAGLSSEQRVDAVWSGPLNAA